jgi:hypothetical protein
MAAFSDTLKLDWEGILKNVRFDAVAWQPYEWEPVAPRVTAFDGITPTTLEAQRETTLAVEALRADLAQRADAKELRERMSLWLLSSEPCSPSVITGMRP